MIPLFDRFRTFKYDNDAGQPSTARVGFVCTYTTEYIDSAFTQHKYLQIKYRAVLVGFGCYYRRRCCFCFNFQRHADCLARLIIHQFSGYSTRYMNNKLIGITHPSRSSTACSAAVLRQTFVQPGRKTFSVRHHHRPHSLFASYSTVVVASTEKQLKLMSLSKYFIPKLRADRI